MKNIIVDNSGVIVESTGYRKLNGVRGFTLTTRPKTIQEIKEDVQNEVRKQLKGKKLIKIDNIKEAREELKELELKYFGNSQLPSKDEKKIIEKLKNSIKNFEQEQKAKKVEQFNKEVMEEKSSIIKVDSIGGTRMSLEDSRTIQEKEEDKLRSIGVKEITEKGGTTIIKRF